MSQLFGGNPFKDLERKIKRSFESLGNDIKNQVESAGNQAKNSIRDIGNQGISEITGAVNQAESTISNASGKALKEVTDFGEDAIGKVEGAGKSVIGDIEGAGKSVIGDVEGVALTVKNEVNDIATDIEHFVEEKLDALVAAIVSEALEALCRALKTGHREMSRLEKNKPELIGEINSVSQTIQLGPITLKYLNFYTRVEGVLGVLDGYVNEPPRFHRSDIIAMIQALGPDTVDFGIDVSFALVIGSKSLGLGGGMGAIGMGLFTEIADTVLKEMGVPE